MLFSSQDHGKSKRISVFFYSTFRILGAVLGT